MFDEIKAKEFYIDFLGFRVDWEYRVEAGLPLYVQISKDSCVIHLSEHHGDGCPGAAVRIQPNELEEFQRELMEKQYRHARPGIEAMPWGSRDMTITDPFGNRLTFTNAISISFTLQRARTAPVQATSCKELP